MFQLAASAEAPSVRQQQLPALGGYEALDDSRAQSLSHPSLQAFPAEAAVIMEHRQATSTVFSKFLIHRTHEHNNCCLTPLKFGVVCYIATVSECTSMKCDHCCSKNGFTGELASCRISSGAVTSETVRGWVCHWAWWGAQGLTFLQYYLKVFIDI